MKIRALILTVICSLLIILFIYTGINKMMDYGVFKNQLSSALIIRQIAGFVAAALPAGELLIALSLISKRTRLIGLYASSALMVLFTGYIGIMLYFGYHLPCNCGGILPSMSWRTHLVFNSVFTALAFIGVVLQRRTNRGDFNKRNNNQIMAAG